MCAAENGAEGTKPSPPREGCRVTPLIEAADMYPMLEHLVLDAEKSVWMAFRVFDPEAKTHSDRCRDLGLSNWTDLVRHTVERGVAIRLLLADFEPVMADYLHAGSWGSHRTLRDLIETLPPDRRELLQLVVVEHEGEIGWAWRQLLRFALRRRIRRVIDKLLHRDSADDGGLHCRPGLWGHVRWREGEPAEWKPGPTPRLWPATYHQKFVVVDGEKAIVGGIDVNDRRWDDRRHRQRTDRTWHDISALVEGPAVGDIARHFARLWDREIPRYRATVAEWTDGCGRELMLDPLKPIGVEPALPDPVEGTAQVQMVRTISRHVGGIFATGPRPTIREIKAAHRSLIGSARKQIYIEAQFFRSRDASRWLADALERNPELEVIVLVANVPEEIAFEGQADNLAHRHGEHLQARALGRLLKKAGPKRIGLFTLAKHEPVRADERKFEESRGTAFGSGVIHIHSKLVVADDSACLLSSANINGRSFEWDTELGILWVETGDTIAAFKERLWRQLFGGDLPEGMNLEGWRDIARFNSGAEPQDRKGFVVPYQLGRARRFGRPYWFIPDDLV